MGVPKIQNVEQEISGRGTDAINGNHRNPHLHTTGVNCPHNPFPDSEKRKIEAILELNYI